MKHLSILFFVLLGIASHAATVKKDTVYTHINSLLKTINTTKKQKATYYVTLTTKDNDSIKLRIDFRKLKANIPIYSSKNTHFDIKAFLSLNQEQVNQTNQKLKAFDDKVKEYGVASKQLRALEKQLAQLKAVDSSQLDTIAIADLQEKIQTKQETKTQLQQSYESLFSAYETQRNRLLGNLQIDYRQRVRAAINEAYKKLKNRETKFQSFDDDALFYDIRINLLKVDATRAMKVNYRARGKNKNVTQDISAGKTYFISHFAEFGAYYEEEQVKAIFKAIKRQEAQRNPYLPYEPFALVTSDKDLTQEYINRIVDYKNYKGEFKKEEEEVEEEEEEEEILDNNPLKIMKLRKESNGYPQQYVGMFGCVRYAIPSSCSHEDHTHVVTGKNKPHMGVDLLASLNTPIYSAVDGVAYVYPSEINGYGKIISVKGKLKNIKTGKKEAVYVVYAHLNSIDVKNGDAVKVGDILGKTGKTGNGKELPEEEEHLHLEILTQKWPNKSKGFSIRKPPLDYFKVINP